MSSTPYPARADSLRSIQWLSSTCDKNITPEWTLSPRFSASCVYPSPALDQANRLDLNLRRIFRSSIIESVVFSLPFSA